MGTQLHVKTVDLLKAGFTVEISLFVYKEEGEPDYYDYRAHCKDSATGQSFYMNCFDSLVDLWSDYNDWGSNKAVIKPFIDKYKIPHITS